MNSRASWVSVITASVFAAALALLAAPAGPASAGGAQRAAALTASTSPPPSLPLATGGPRHPRGPG